MDEQGQPESSRIPLILRLGAQEPRQLAERVEQLCGAGLPVETARRFAPGDRVALALVLPRLESGRLEVEVEVLRRSEGEDGSPRGVVVRVPPDRERDRRELLQLAQGQRAGAESTHRICRVLVVEDNALVRRLYAQALETVAEQAKPVEVRTEFVEDGAQALARLTRRPMIDLLLADLYMPVLDGFELLERIRAEAGLAGLPVVVLTGGDDEAAGRARALGARLILRKPVRTAAIASAARELLELAVV